MQRVLVGIGGGIAAYKICEAISQLFQGGCEVRAILTEGAQRFVSPLTVATLSRHQAYTDADFWQPHRAKPLHIELGEWADVFLLAPLTANTLAKLNYGLADNLLTNTVLASTCPILLAPAMNTDMWLQDTVSQNWRSILAKERYHSIGPAAGLLACDRVGTGRMAEPSEIVAAIESLLYTKGRRSLAGKKVLISAGGTREWIDPVRCIANPSTGKMGLALARAASSLGAEVTLVHASLPNSPLGKIVGISVTTAAEMHDRLLQELPAADIIIMAAAVADVKPANYSNKKLAKSELPNSLELTAVPDIVADLSRQKRSGQLLIGFAAQTGDIITPAREKLARKNLDAIVANAIDIPELGFGSDRNAAIWIDRRHRQIELKSASKLTIAHQIFDAISTLT
jgi:phosphopantothenoylcysteine decarboxylase / phosphopantothenate---cysteine ligase